MYACNLSISRKIGETNSIQINIGVVPSFQGVVVIGCLQIMINALFGSGRGLRPFPFVLQLYNDGQFTEPVLDS